jgi:hypothetical protein
MRDEGKKIKFPLEEIKQMSGDLILNDFAIYLGVIAQSWSSEGNQQAWMEFFDNVGRYPWVRVYKRETSSLPALVREFSSRPERLGVLRVISLLAEHQEDVSAIPHRLLDYDRMNEPMFADAALAVRLLQGDLNPHEAKAIAERVPPLLENKMEFTGKLSEILQTLRQETSLEGFFVELSKALPPSKWDVSVDVANTLNDFLRRRESRLRNPRVWTALKLPEDLKPLLH